VGRGFSQDVSALDSSGVLAPEARKWRMSLLAMECDRSQNPDPLIPRGSATRKSKSHFLSVDVLEWYHSIVLAGKRKNAKGSATRDITVTCGNNGLPPTDSHFYGWAVDIGQNTNPWLTRAIAVDCFTKSFLRGPGGSYAQQKYNSSDPNQGWHFHFQYFPGKNYSFGFAPLPIEPQGK